MTQVLSVARHIRSDQIISDQTKEELSGQRWWWQQSAGGKKKKKKKKKKKQKQKQKQKQKRKKKTGCSPKPGVVPAAAGWQELGRGSRSLPGPGFEDRPRLTASPPSPSSCDAAPLSQIHFLLLILFGLDRPEKNNKKWTKTWTSMRQKLVVHLLLQSVIRDWILQMLQWQCVPFLASSLRNWDCGERWRGSRVSLGKISEGGGCWREDPAPQTLQLQQICRLYLFSAPFSSSFSSTFFFAADFRRWKCSSDQKSRKSALTSTV